MFESAAAGITRHRRMPLQPFDQTDEHQHLLACLGESYRILPEARQCVQLAEIYKTPFAFTVPLKFERVSEAESPLTPPRSSLGLGNADSTYQWFACVWPGAPPAAQMNFDLISSLKLVSPTHVRRIALLAYLSGNSPIIIEQSWGSKSLPIEPEGVPVGALRNGKVFVYIETVFPEDTPEMTMVVRVLPERLSRISGATPITYKDLHFYDGSIHLDSGNTCAIS